MVFAVKLVQDMEAVVAALVLSCSQDQTEGRINELELVKRSMYWRGGFDLLRQGVLYAAASWRVPLLLSESLSSIHQIHGRTALAGNSTGRVDNVRGDPFRALRCGVSTECR
jgi:hypothetical protein